MSFFYLTPVKGELPAHLLEIIVLKRIEFLSALIKRQPTVFNEYVMEGSLYDNVGHFMLCIVTVLCKHRDFSQFVIKAESELFKCRLAALSAYDMRLFAKKLIQTLKRYNNVTRLEPLYHLCHRLMLKHIGQHVSAALHDDLCVLYNIQLSFTHCLQFVAKREVEINNGTAAVPCGKWKQYLSQVFQINLLHQINAVNSDTLYHDPRINEIIGKVKKEYCSARISNNNLEVVLAKNIDSLSELFPPCMLNLHRSLRKQHRLSHEQRFFFSLFLKDIGMPVDEAVEFWRDEYRQIATGGVCCHSWERDEKKYLYSIRHMYGLEGARKSYTSVSCQRIQNNMNSKEGGCPFKTFDITNMIHLLSPNCKESRLVLSQINEYKVKKLYTSACVYHLQQSFSKSTAICDNFSFNFTPVKHYKIALEANKL